MRISDSMRVHTTLASINKTTNKLEKANEQLSSGLRINSPSDDPLGAERAVNLQTAIDNIDQYTRNITQANSLVSSSESALNTAGTLITQARSLALQGANGTLDTNGRQAVASEIDSIITQIAQIANTKVGSKYIFSGQLTNVQPFVETGNTYVYQGGTAADGNGAVNMVIDQNSKIQVNATGDDTFGTVLTALTNIRDTLNNTPDGATVNLDLDSLDSATATFQTALSGMGNKLRLLNNTSDRLATVKTNLSSYLSNIQDADTTQVVVDIQAAENAYQAALTATSRTFSTSLMDFLR